MKGCYVVIRENGEIELSESDGSLDSLRKLAGGHIEAVYAPYMPLRERTVMFIDEERKLKGKGRNKLATELYGEPDDFIAGDAVVALETRENEYGESETPPYTEDTAASIIQVLVTVKWAIDTSCWETLKELLARNRER